MFFNHFQTFNNYLLASEKEKFFQACKEERENDKNV